MRLIAAVIVLRVIDFNPRTPGGVRPPLEMLFAMSFNYFNPRTPGGVRHWKKRLFCSIKDFNPRTPGGVRPPRAAKAFTITSYFNPRTPGGVRPFDIRDHGYTQRFQSTHPGWGATRDVWVEGDELPISIHAPRVGCDRMVFPQLSALSVFQSTHPGWGATAKVHKRRNGFYVLLRIFFHLYVKTVIFGAMLV